MPQAIKTEIQTEQQSLMLLCARRAAQKIRTSQIWGQRDQLSCADTLRVRAV